MRSGFVSLIGRPNVGKSTLLNTLINEKIAITSTISGTTRNIIQGIYNEADYQIVFMDTPGIIRPINKLGKITNKQALSLTKDIDCLLFVVDASAGLGKGDNYIIEILKKSEAPVILVLNKIDKLTEEEIMASIIKYKDLYPFSEIVPISALKNDNVKRLIDVIKKYLKDEIRYFDPNMKTSNSKYFMISEIVREKLFCSTVEEIPHSLTAIQYFMKKRKILLIFM